MINKILLISNLYPGIKNASYGTFVRSNHFQLSRFSKKVDLCVIDTKSANYIFKIFIYSKFFVRQFYFLFFKKKEYDFFYYHYLTISTIPLFIYTYFFRQNIRYFINVHGDDLVGGTIKHKILSLTSSYLIKKSSGIILPSDNFKKILLDKFKDKIDESKICVNYSCGINLKKFKKKQVSSDELDEIVFGYVGRIEEGKGWQDFIKAIEKIKVKNKIKFIFYGNGKQLPDLINSIDKLKSKYFIEYGGELNYHDVPNKISNFTFLVFPTYRESLGLVALEAASIGIPVIRTKIQVLNDIFYSFESLSYQATDVEQLAKIISQYAKIDYQEYKIISEQHHQLSVQYSSDKCFHLLEKFILEKVNET